MCYFLKLLHTVMALTIQHVSTLQNNNISVTVNKNKNIHAVTLSMPPKTMVIFATRFLPLHSYTMNEE